MSWAEAAGNGKTATLGWCFSGGWSVNVALKNDLDAAVIYYGQVKADTDELAKLQAPLLGHFGTPINQLTLKWSERFSSVCAQSASRIC